MRQIQARMQYLCLFYVILRNKIQKNSVETTHILVVAADFRYYGFCRYTTAGR